MHTDIYIYRCERNNFIFMISLQNKNKLVNVQNQVSYGSEGKEHFGDSEEVHVDDSAHMVYSMKGRICFVKVKWLVIP